MKVKCIENQKTDSLKKHLGESFDSYKSFDLIKEKEYLVYAITEMEGSVWYCIEDEYSTYFPRWNPSSLFEIIDPSLSKYWVFSFDEKSFIISFPEWARDPMFYTNLVELDDHEQLTTFRKYKELMLLECPDWTISEIATIGDFNWLLCPTCIDAWQPSPRDSAMVRCPHCQKLLQNPFAEWVISKNKRIIKGIFDLILNLPVCTAEIGYGSFISIGFEKEVEYYIKVRGAVKKRSRPEWLFTTHMCFWNLKSGSKTLCTSDDDKEVIATSLQTLLGKKLLSIEILSDVYDMQLIFEDSITLSVIANNTEPENIQWQLLTPALMALVAGPLTHLSYEEAGAFSDR